MIEFIWNKTLGLLWNAVVSEGKERTFGEIVKGICTGLTFVQIVWVYLYALTVFVAWVGWHPAISISIMVLVLPIYLFVVMLGLMSYVSIPVLAVLAGIFAYFTIVGRGFDQVSGIVGSAWVFVIWLILLWFTWAPVLNRDK